MTWADRDAAGSTAVVDGRIVLGLSQDGALRTRGLLPGSVLARSAWLAARLDGGLVWEGVVGEDRALTLLDGGSLVATGGWVRVPRPLSRALVVSPGGRSALLVWLAEDRQARYAIWKPDRVTENR